MLRVRVLLVAAGALVLANAPACSSSPAPETPLAVPAGCEPLAVDPGSRAACALPFPSDFFRVSDASTATGFRVVLSGAAKLTTPDGVDADVTGAFPADGASLQPSIGALLPGPIVSDGLPNVLDDPTRSQDLAASPTLILRADTGEAVPHYVDLDPRPDDPARIEMALRPFVRLAPNTRYVVAVRHVKVAGGGEAPPAEGFRRLRDRDTALDPSLQAIAPRFETDVFGVLAAHGVARDDLQLGWDFTTGSEEQPQADMLHVRELTLAWLQAHTPKVQITGVDADSHGYWRVVHGTVTGPLFMDGPDPGARLFRGPDGKVAQNGEVDFPFEAVIPVTVRDQFGPGRALALGHGFFGAMTEVEDGGATVYIPALHAVTFAIDWWGMSKADLDSVIAHIVQSPAHGFDFVDRVHQAMANWLVMTAAMKGPLASEDAFKRPASGPGTGTDGGGNSNAGALVYDPAHVFYFGASMGHILGGTMAALNPDVERAALDVGGAAWTQMMPRASPFSSFSLFIKSTLNDELAAQALQVMGARELDRIDPATYAPYLIGAKLPGNPDRKVLLQIGIGDAGVPNVASFFHARALGLSQVAPNPGAVWGIPDADASTLGSALTVWDFGIDPGVYREPVAPDANAVHEGVRRDPKAIAQMDAFLKPDGVVIDPCQGPCKAQ